MSTKAIALQGALLLFAAWVSPVRSVEISPASPPYEQHVADSRYACAANAALEHLKNAHRHYKLPSINAAVSIDGELVWAAAVGWADLERRVPASLDTRYRIGSTSKLVTATLLARLHSQGRIDLDEPLGQYASDLPNASWKQLTARQLASHTAGIVGYAENRDLLGLLASLSERRQFDSVRHALSMFDGSGLMFNPGESFHYTTFGTVLLSYAIEQAGGGNYLELLRTEVAAPAGLRSIEADTSGTEPHRLHAVHYKRTRRGTLVPWRTVNHSYKWAGGGLVATSSDLAILGGRWFDEEFIAATTVKEFFTPQRLADGSENPQSYAIGARSNESVALLGAPWAVRSVNHGGVSKGANSWLNLYPDLRLAIALNTNVRLEEFRDFIQLEYPITRVFAVSAPGADGRLPPGALGSLGGVKGCADSYPDSQ